MWEVLTNTPTFSLRSVSIVYRLSEIQQKCFLTGVEHLLPQSASWVVTSYIKTMFIWRSVHLRDFCIPTGLKWTGCLLKERRDSFWCFLTYIFGYLVILSQYWREMLEIWSWVYSFFKGAQIPLYIFVFVSQHLYHFPEYSDPLSPVLDFTLFEHTNTPP